ncbi:MAG: 50S ribosomal protein L3 [Pseudomonadota bacterium]|nr:50S ribosomal protein L3 [Pseudomonadota bacterium]
MTIGMVGRKCGMTRVFSEDGLSVAVTVLEMQPNRVTQVKTEDKEGYRAIQVTCGQRRPVRVNKPMSGHLAKAGIEPGRGLWEFRLHGTEGSEIQVGHTLTTDMFTAGQKVDVRGITKGKGFAGSVKRHHFRTQDATHGNSLSHRVPGSVGQNQTPGRVFKGKKMPGQLGNVQRSVQNLEVVRVDTERNVLLLKGAVPGAPGGDVIVRPAIKIKR